MKRHAPFRILPVIDLQQGIAVHGRAGRRDEYQPVQSILAPSADPLELARGVREQLGLTEIYVADLDAIGGSEPNWNVLTRLGAAGMHLFLDAAIENVGGAEQILARLPGRVDLVIGLETLRCLEDLEALMRVVPSDQFLVSLDMDGLQVRTQIGPWKNQTPMHVAEQLVRLGVTRLLLLDISRVGMDGGVGTEPLIRELCTGRHRTVGSHHVGSSEARTTLQIWCGGGIRSIDDLRAARQLGCEGVLIASALHSGRITRCDLENLLSER